LHMEGLRDGERFLRVAERVSREKPVLVFKTGRSPAGAHAAASHSASLAGEDKVYEAAFRRCGLMRVRNVEELNALSKTFATYGSPPGRRTAVITFTGGGGIAVLDALSDHGLEIATFSEDTVRELEGYFPAWMEVKNPLDIWPAAMAHGYPTVYRSALRSVLADPNVDAVLCVVGGNMPPDHDPLCVADVVKEEARACPEKPVLVWVFGAAHHDYAVRVEEGNVVVAYRSPDLAALALARLYEFHHRPVARGTAVPAETP
ncbi:MAG: CoA-binding protein, partial [Firmicutes bacterium]|nr:CoA-binding protein [Bacillota bacterium]